MERANSLAGGGKGICESRSSLVDKKDVMTKSSRGAEIPAIIEDGSLDVSTSAYQRALCSFSEDQRRVLTSQEAITSLFQQLNQTDRDHFQQSLIRKGFKAVSPHLQRLSTTIGFVSPFVSMEPAAGTALGLVKGVTSIAIAVCDCAHDITDHVVSFLERIPAIDRCSDVAKDDGRLPNIYSGLVNVYKDLLQFYLKTVALSAKSQFVLRVALSVLKLELPEVISSFNAHADLLSKQLESETFASIQEIKQEQVDTLIRDTLDRYREHEASHHDELRQRIDEACSWIKSNEAFSYWMLHSHDSNLLALFGDVGCGKTMTSAYVRDSLSRQQRLVCAFYCKDDYPSSDLGNIYRSLLWKLLKQKPDLKIRFWNWYDDDVEAALPPGLTRIELGSSKERDWTIATYLADQINLPKVLRGKAVDELAARADGSAIWLRIAVEYIGKLRIKNQIGLESALEQLPSSKALALLYSRLFDKTCSDIADNKQRLQRALETLAVAQRPLTSEELSHAVFINLEGGSITTLSGLERQAHSMSLFDLVRPFVSATNVGVGKDPRVRLVHQSLKELILQAPPSNWCSEGKPSRRQQSEERMMELNGLLLRGRIRYLLFEECEKVSLLLGFKNGSDDTELFTIGSVFDDDNDNDDDEDQRLTASASTGSKPSQDFNPFELGFGEFFAYAASYWTYHFSNVSSEWRPDPLDLVVLCRKESQRLENWVEQWRRPNCSYIAEHDFPEAMSHLDPLVVTAMFGPAESLADVLRLDLRGPDFAKDSAWTAITHVIARDHISIIKDLLGHKVLRSSLCCTAFFYAVVCGCSWSVETHDNAPGKWRHVFEFLVQELRDDLLDHGNDILCLAARSGCLVLVKTLFVAADRDGDLRRSILAAHRKLGYGNQFLGTHQSIGEAAYEGHADIVRFLCQQTDIESHLLYTSKDGNTVFHLAARGGNAEVFRILIQRWPEGVHHRNHAHDTPLVDLIYRSPGGEAETVNLVRLLLGRGKADATGRDDDAGYSPLCTAMRRGSAALSRVLIVEGLADVTCAVGIDQTNGKPFLTKHVNTIERVEDQEKMLKELCSLLPLAVSVQYLF